MRRVLSLLAVAAMLTGVSAEAATPAKIVVYTGDSPLISGFSLFAAASGRGLDERTSLPTDMTSVPCVILPANDATFTSGTLTKLSNYVKDGGHLFALGDGSLFRGPNGNMNAVAAKMGSTMSLTPADIDIGFHTTTNIDPSPYTAGVSSIVYAFTSKINPGSGSSLFRTAAAGSTDVIAAAETIGEGVLVLSGDTNVWSDTSGGGYSSAGNGVVARNLCGLRTTLVAYPAVADLDVPSVNLTLSATLSESESSGPLAGQTIAFRIAGADVCSGITDTTGTASCGAPVDAVSTALNSGYEARFGGAGFYASSAAHGAVLHALGSDVL